MFKNIIAPVQAWLLSKGSCVGCGTSLENGDHQKSKIKGMEQVICKCGRIFIYNPKDKSYRRALLNEI